MADRLDVAARLAEGRLAVERTQTYVRACHVLGYQHPDLTAHGSQVYDWYDTEAGLDLRVLDHDTAELWTAVNAIEEALNVQCTQSDELAAAWRGPGADSATRFLRRHCDAAAEVAAHVRTAAERCGTLRDELWQLVDGKAATAIAIDDRRAAERSAWLAAAQTVTTGAGDQSAEELVRQQVNPYVDNDIRVDWLTAMRSTTASVAAAYEGATGALTHVAEACFELPGELGPSSQPVVNEPAADSAPFDPVPAVSTMPAAVSAPPPPTTVAAPTLPADPLAALPPVPPELAAPLGDAAGLSTGAGGLGGSGGLGGLAGNIGGVVGKIVDGIGGLIGSLADGFGDLSGPGDPLDADEADEPDELDDKDVEPDGKEDEPDEPDDADADDATSETADENSPPADDAVDEPAAEEAIPPPSDPPPPAEPATVEPPPADPSASTPEPAAEGSTPCEIAADELPQAGQ